MNYSWTYIKNLLCFLVFLDNTLDGVTVEQALAILDAEVAAAQNKSDEFRKKFADKLASEESKKSPFKDVIREALKLLTPPQPPKKIAAVRPMEVGLQQVRQSPEQEEERQDLRDAGVANASKQSYIFFLHLIVRYDSSLL